MEQYRQTEEIKSAEVKAYYIPARAKEEIYHNTKILYVPIAEYPQTVMRN